MRISDWSSDVCSSDLLIAEFVVQFRAIARALDIDRESLSKRSRRLQYDHAVGKQKGLVHIIGDKDDGLALLRANTLDLRLQLRPGQRIERRQRRSEEHTSELQSLIRISYDVFCLI